MSRRVLGMILRESGDMDRAIEEFEKAKSILEPGRTNSIAQLYYDYGLLHKAKGDMIKAKEHIEEALSMFEEMGMKLQIDKAQKALEELNQ